MSEVELKSLEKHRLLEEADRMTILGVETPRPQRRHLERAAQEWGNWDVLSQYIYATGLAFLETKKGDADDGSTQTELALGREEKDLYG